MRAKPRRDREANHGQTIWLRTGLAGSHKQYHVIGVTDGASQPAVKYLIGLVVSLAPVSRVLQVPFQHQWLLPGPAPDLEQPPDTDTRLVQERRNGPNTEYGNTVVVDLDGAAYDRHNQVDGRLWSG